MHGAIQRLKGSKALDHFAISCRLAARELGFEHFLLLVRFPDADRTPLQIVISGQPTEWERLYDHHEWVVIDPLISKAMTTNVPFACDEIEWNASTRSEAMRSAMRLHAVDHVVTVPLRGPGTEIGLMNFMRREPVPALAERRNGLISLCQLYAHRIYASLIDAVREVLRSDASQCGPLTGRERQVLSLAARGNRVKVIASMLDIAPTTVTYFLRRAAERLGTATVRGAIYRAAMRGELQLAEYPLRLDSSTAFVRERSRVAEPAGRYAHACQI